MVHHVMPNDSGGTYVHAGLSLRLSANYASCQTDAPVTGESRLSIRREREGECNIANSTTHFML